MNYWNNWNFIKQGIRSYWQNNLKQVYQFQLKSRYRSPKESVKELRNDTAQLTIDDLKDDATRPTQILDGLKLLTDKSFGAWSYWNHVKNVHEVDYSGLRLIPKKW